MLEWPWSTLRETHLHDGSPEVHRLGTDLAGPQLGEVTLFLDDIGGGCGRSLLSPLGEPRLRGDLLPKAGLSEGLLGSAEAESGRHDSVRPTSSVSGD